MGAGRVKLLLDENLSRRIVPALQTAFPGTTQVALAGLERADDRAVWEYAKAAGYTLVTKDDDFAGLLSVLGYPPKVVRLSMGNCTNQRVINALLKSREEIGTALANPEIGLVEVY